MDCRPVRSGNGIDCAGPNDCSDGISLNCLSKASWTAATIMACRKVSCSSVKPDMADGMANGLLKGSLWSSVGI